MGDMTEIETEGQTDAPPCPPVPQFHTPPGS